MIRPVLRIFKSPKSAGRRGCFTLPASTIVVSLFGVGSVAYAYQLGFGNGRTAISARNASSFKPKYGGPKEIHQAIKELQAALPNQVRIDPLTVEAYGFSPHTYIPGSPHAVYVAATSTEDVVKAVNISRKYKIPIIPFGVGNSLEGHFSGVRYFVLE